MAVAWLSLYFVSVKHTLAAHKVTLVSITHTTGVSYFSYGYSLHAAWLALWLGIGSV